MDELTDVEKRIFDTVVAKHKDPVNEPFLKIIIKLANTNGDGFKRVSLLGDDWVRINSVAFSLDDSPPKDTLDTIPRNKATYLIPIEDIILDGLKASDLGTKYVLQEK